MHQKLLGWLVAAAMLLVAPRGRAEEAPPPPPKGGVRTIESNSARYHVALIVADGAAAVLGASALYAMDGSDHAASRQAIVGFGVAAAGAYVLGGPLVHLANGHVGRAAASLGLRAIGLLAGVGAFHLADKGFEALDKRDCPSIGQDGGGSCALASVGLYFGFALLSTAALMTAFGTPVGVDHAFVAADSKRDVARAPRVGFAVVPTKERTTATLTVSF